MINSRILNMTTLATITCNSNILDVLNNKMNGNKRQLNMMNNQIRTRRTYRLFAYIVAAVTLLMTTLVKTGQSSWR
jgi:hypothetical protein